jgi:hypothetical protein
VTLWMDLVLQRKVPDVHSPSDVLSTQANGAEFGRLQHSQQYELATQIAAMRVSRRDARTAASRLGTGE